MNKILESKFMNKVIDFISPRVIGVVAVYSLIVVLTVCIMFVSRLSHGGELRKSVEEVLGTSSEVSETVSDNASSEPVSEDVSTEDFESAV